MTPARPQHIPAKTTHTRGGTLSRSFTYSIDYVLIDPEHRSTPLLFSRNRFNLASVHDKNHGGAPKHGTGVVWARQQFASIGLGNIRVLLLTQPRFLGYVFNPISFWLAYDGDKLMAVIAEVNNTFGDRHSYLCKTPKTEPISPENTLKAAKLMHVSPFQEVNGEYSFKFNILDDKICIKIQMCNGSETLFANLIGPRQPLTNRAIISAALRRPFGPLRTIALIYWQALRLKLRGAPYKTRPAPPEKEISG
ncbi:DUF1365 domain-containing protein [Cognatishimia sp. WU-CL00825]|uniref:DUF1365 domain-containing protein n=1 Tax=Cognatishimia sp. WU-CL00825 TaxID=3127658 RepID=UPI00310BA915